MELSFTAGALVLELGPGTRNCTQKLGTALERTQDCTIVEPHYELHYCLERVELRQN